ncbi:MAG: NapC/NirT family cytochrome c [Lentimicrobiaceae bacterium]|jgi:nitrate/TMAO reductase-like tetraheme cytochrome c subunit
MKMPKNAYNWITITGFLLAVNSLIVIVLLFLFSMLQSESNPYMGLFTYIVSPAFMVLGLLMIPIGMWNKRKKMKGQDYATQKWPILDMNNKFNRTAVIRISIITLVLLVATAMGSYQAFHYTESVKFCGTLCHKVMEPEYTAYQHSSHANVKCVECHVGEGAGWYVKSKLSGLYQVYSVIFKKYSTPIETPLHNLRPASETCEKCHWPEKFYSQKLRNLRTYIADSGNTEWNTSLLMKIGPQYSAKGLSEGIHWHINKDYRIEYIAGTKDRESIPWVKLTDLKTGKVKIFMDEENPIDKKAMDSLEHRTMDCMDCHNRPSHDYLSAPKFIDDALVSGLIPKDIPYIKMAAMEALKVSYNTKDSAHIEIKNAVLTYYKDEHPEVYAKNSQRINKAIPAMIGEYDKNVFPFMKVEASKYLDHIGHLESDGCFRCHSDTHKTATGETISRNCDLCHTILAQGPTGNVKTIPLGSTMEFIHPVEIRGKWKTAFCSECHKVLYE